MLLRSTGCYLRQNCRLCFGIRWKVKNYAECLGITPKIPAKCRLTQQYKCTPAIFQYTERCGVRSKVVYRQRDKSDALTKPLEAYRKEIAPTMKRDEHQTALNRLPGNANVRITSGENGNGRLRIRLTASPLRRRITH